MSIKGRTKAAIFLLSIGNEAAAKIYSHLAEGDIEDITMELANLGPVEPETVDEVMQEFWHSGLAQKFVAMGDITYARDVLSQAFGEAKAGEMIQRLSTFLQVTPFDFVRRADPQNLINFIQNEHPQTISLILAYLEPTQGAEILQKLPAALQADVARRMALMGQSSPEVIREIERVLEKNLSSFITQMFSSAGGVDSVVAVLNQVDRATEKGILEVLEKEDPNLAMEIKQKMFIFEDITILDDRAIQQVLREVDSKMLGMALKGVSEEVADKIFRNMSKRAAAMLKEDMEFAGPVRIKDVEAAQQQIVGVIRSLEDAGEIVIARGEGEVVM